MEDAFDELMAVYTKEHNTHDPMEVVEVSKFKQYNTRQAGASVKSHHKRIVQKCEIFLVQDEETDIPSEQNLSSDRTMKINSSSLRSITSS